MKHLPALALILPCQAQSLTMAMATTKKEALQVRSLSQLGQGRSHCNLGSATNPSKSLRPTTSPTGCVASSSHSRQVPQQQTSYQSNRSLRPAINPCRSCNTSRLHTSRSSSCPNNLLPKSKGADGIGALHRQEGCPLQYPVHFIIPQLWLQCCPIRSSW